MSVLSSKNILAAGIVAAALVSAPLTSAHARFYIMHDDPTEVITHHANADQQHKEFNKQSQSNQVNHNASQYHQYGRNDPRNYNKQNYRPIASPASQNRHSNQKSYVSHNRKSTHLPFFVDKDTRDNAQLNSDNGYVTGFGKHISFRMLASQVLPESWGLECRYQACDNKVITWQALEPVLWKSIIQGGFKAIEDSNLLMSFNKDSRKIIISKDVRTSQYWELSEDKTLRQTLKSMAESSGYNFVWSNLLEDKDWNVGMTQQIQGTMHQAISDVVSAFKAKGVLIQVTFNDNLKIVEVEPLKSMVYMKNKTVKLKTQSPSVHAVSSMRGYK